MNEIRIRDPHTEATALLKMDAKHASIKFQQYTVDEQLAIIQTVPDAKSREELYYLVPDCAELVQQSPIESVMQMGLVHLGTGQSVGILSAASSEQLAEIIDLVAYLNGELYETRLEAWLMEMLHGGDDIFETALCAIDVHLLSEFFMNRLELDFGSRLAGIPYPAFAVEEALVSPEDLSYDSEDTELLIETIYAVDGDLFQALMEHIFLQDTRALDGWDDFRKRETREAVKGRIEKRDQEKGVTEEELLKLVDLDNLQLKDGKLGKSQQGEVTETDLLELVDLDNVQLNE